MNKIKQKPPLVIMKPKRVQISDHPDPTKSHIKRMAKVLEQDEKYNTNQAFVKICIEHYNTISFDENGNFDELNSEKNISEKDVEYLRIADNHERIDPATGLNVSEFVLDENGNIEIDAATNKKKLNPDFDSAVYEYIALSNNPILVDENGKLWIGAVGYIEVETNTMMGISNAINKYYVERFDNNGFLGIDLYK